MKESLPGIYKDLFNTEAFKPKPKKLTLGLILGEETADFYDRYFSDLNLIIVSSMSQIDKSKEIDSQAYYDYAVKLILSFFADDNKNKNIIENFFNALSIISGSDDVTELMETTIELMYQKYYI